MGKFQKIRFSYWVIKLYTAEIILRGRKEKFEQQGWKITGFFEICYRWTSLVFSFGLISNTVFPHSFRGNYSFLNLEIQSSQYINVRKLFKGGNYTGKYGTFYAFIKMLKKMQEDVILTILIKKSLLTNTYLAILL